MDGVGRGRVEWCERFWAGSRGVVSGTVVMGLGFGLWGCAGPDEQTEALREIVRSATARQIAEAAGSPAARPLERANRIEGLGLSDERLEELGTISGALAYMGDGLELSDDLLGGEAATVEIGLSRVIAAAVVGNLGVQSARIVPAVSASQVVQADAAFDWVLTASMGVTSADTPTTQTLSFDNAGNPIVLGAPAQSAFSTDYQAGLQKNLITGGVISVDWTISRTDQNTPGFAFVPDPATTSSMQFELVQPLLRNAGSGVAESEIRIAANAERRSISELRAAVRDTILGSQEAYWRLVQARDNLRIQRRLLARGIETSEKIRQRGRLDATAAQIADAVASVEQRRADVITAEDTLFRASDALKAIVNDPELPVGSETVLLPINPPEVDPLEFSLFDSISTALERQPEMRQAILTIDDQSIRQFVADNQRLPQLDLTFQARALALDNDATEAALEPIGSDFFEYVVGLQFLRPIGNRAAEANYRATVLARLQSVIDYQATAQDVVLDVKEALRDVRTNFALIEQRRASRLAAAENLRALTVQIELTEGFSATNLDLLLRTQESLAAEELREVDAVAGYNVAIARLEAATGTSLERSGIRLDESADSDTGPFLP